MLTKKIPTIVLTILIFSACKKDNTNPAPVTDDGAWWKPAAGVSFDWDLDDITSSDTFSSAVVDVDAFTTSAETVATLHAAGKKVIAYISVGTLEDDRPDKSMLPKEVIGKIYDEWPHEKWLDIRQIDKLKPWLEGRIAMIKNKHFDGVEPDNMDGYDNETGFAIKIADTKKYADYLITLAHANGLSIGQKNVEDLTAEYAAKFDWALTEDAFQQGWAESMVEYITLKKPVFAVEYTDVTSQNKFENIYCPKAHTMGFTAILKRRDLNKWVYKCE